MADRNQKVPENVPGPFYVDVNCIDCDMCREIAPQFFRRNEETGYSYVYRQPVTPGELALAQEASQCPVEAIGSDGDIV